MGKVDDSVYLALLKDQCVHGFQHTQDQIANWMCGGVTQEGRKSLMHELNRCDKELDGLDR